MNHLTRNSLGAAAAFAAGALAMYYLDATMGQRRRALARERVIGAAREAADFAAGQGKHLADRAKGVMATGRIDRQASSQPEDDAHLRERVLSRLGHWVSHPRAMAVDVNEGVVRVSGQILAPELDGLLSQLTAMPGVRKVHNALSVLDDPSGFGELPAARSQPAPH